jgi:type IV pilus assembly protein PilY1
MRFKLLRAFALAASLFGALLPAAHTQVVTFPDSPLQTSSSVSVKPNLLFVLDDSGSMAWQYTPDYVSGDSTWSSGEFYERMCYDSGDNDWNPSGSTNDDRTGTIHGWNKVCQPGDVPYGAPFFNTQYYNPAIRYRPAVNSDGSSKNSQTAGNTSSWTSVRTDAFNVSNKRFQGGDDTNTANLTQFPDRVWCTAKADAASDADKCKVNDTTYDYPNAAFPYGRDSDNDIKYRYGQPYYWTIPSYEYCTDENMTDCVISSASTTQGGKTYSVPSTVRFCKYTGSRDASTTRETFEFSKLSFDDCQAKYDVDAGYVYPRFLGQLNPPSAGKVPYSKIAFPSNPTVAQDIKQITVNGINILNTAYSNYTTRAALLPALVAGINDKTAATGEQEFRACMGGDCTAIIGVTGGSNDIYIYPTISPASSTPLMTTELNGISPLVTGSPSGPGAKERFTISVGAVTSTGNPGRVGVSQIRVGTSNLLPSGGVVASPITTPAQQAAAIVAAINGASGPSNALFLASSSGAVVTVERKQVGIYGQTVAIDYPTIRPDTTISVTGVSTGNVSRTVLVRIANNITCTLGVTTIGTTVAVTGSGSGSTGNNGRNAVAQRIRDLINNYSDFVASGTGSSVTVEANTNSNQNGWYLCLTGNNVTTSPLISLFTNDGISPMALTPSGFTGGAGTGVVPNSVSPFTGGLTNYPTYYRTDMATWQRVNIVTGGSYPKGSSRSDCANATCTYDEEMTNFANWFTYYRTRMQTMKTASGRSFATLGDNFRVGFTTINDKTGDQFVKINTFNATQKTSWYNEMYETGFSSGGTPLRQALSRAGRVFAGKNPLSTASKYADPVQFSCQQNFTILTTDGYWNEDAESNIKRVDGTRVNNVDSLAGVAAPFFDGGPGSCPTGGTCLNSGCRGDGADTGKFSSCNTLSDVALYYAATDLRTEAFDNCVNQTDGTIKNLCVNNVRETTRDPFRTQHMTTFTLGLGVDGTLSFRDDYETANTGDYALIRAGTKKWPQPKLLHPTAVDDLWHAAVNGRGKYFSAKNPESLSSGLNGALAEVNAQGGAGAAAATSNLEPITGDNFAYVASYTTVKWTGNVEARTINLSTGAVSTTAVWCAEDVLDPVTNNITCNGTMESLVQAGSDTRRIFTYDSSTANGLKTFTFADMTTAQKAMFDPSLLSQYATLDSTSQAAATGANLVNYLRGHFQHENRSTNTVKAFRLREKTLADVIGSQPIYVKKPPFTYNDTDYSDYVKTNENRTGTVYIGANDGMLHAFDSTSGTERWAYVPSAMLPRMRALADFNYTSNHRYFVDGSPKVGDVYYGSAWRTILVGGFSSGGVGYYALDITDPANPKALWEFPGTGENDAGYSYSAPLITKLSNGTWVVIVSSGFNNSGVGYTYVLNAVTGAQIRKISTGTGDAASPSGLNRLTGYAPTMPFDNTTKYVYGGDLKGNLWRFDPAVNNSAKKIATLKDSAGVAQPITTKVEVAQVDGQILLYVGTGKYLESTDLSAGQTQTFYGIRDTFDANGTLTDPRGALSKVTLVDTPDGAGGIKRSSAASTANIITGRGWYADFPVSGERLNVDPQFVNGTLVVLTNVPSNTACESGGSSYINFFNYKSGSVLPGSSDFTTAIVVGFVVVKIGDAFIPLVTLSDSPNPIAGTPVPNDAGDTRYRGRRVSWKELNVD